MSSFDAILFDFDGVLADTEPLHCECWAEALKPFGVVLTWEYYRRHCLGLDDRVMLRMIAAGCDPPRHWEELWAQYPRKKELFRARTLAAPPFPPAFDGWLGRLHLTHRLAVVSSSSRTEIEPLLVAGGLRGHFDTVVCAEDVPDGKLKPEPAPYLLAAQRTGARHPLVVEDSATGAASGRAAGFEVLLVAQASGVQELLGQRLGLGAPGVPAP